MFPVTHPDTAVGCLEEFDQVAVHVQSALCVGVTEVEVRVDNKPPEGLPVAQVHPPERMPGSVRYLFAIPEHKLDGWISNQRKQTLQRPTFQC
jgi:hypothetical protein